MHTHDNHLQAALRTLRDLLEAGVDVFSDMDRTRWYDVIEDLIERHAARSLRRLSIKEG